VSKGSSGSSSGPILAGAPQDASAKSLLHALSEIEQLSIAELRSSLPDGSLPMQPRFTYVDVACKNAALMTLITFLSAPFSIAVTENIMPAFGTSSPALIDKIYVYLFSCAPAIGFSILITTVISKVYTGKVTSRIVNMFTSSYIFTKMMMSLFFLLVFVQLAAAITPDVVWSFLGLFDVIFSRVAEGTKEKAYHLLMNFRAILVPSAVYATLVHVGTSLIIAVGYIRGIVRSNKIEVLRREWE